MYFGIYNIYINQEVFNFSINENENGDKGLVIVNNDGNEAHYINRLLSTNEIKKNDFKIYPNPVDDFLTLENPNLKITEILVVDMQGKILLQQPISSSQKKLDLKNLSKGVYIIQLKSNNKIFHFEKIIKK